MSPVSPPTCAPTGSSPTFPTCPGNRPPPGALQSPMFRTAYRLPFTLLGIPVLLDMTFLIILPIFAFSIAGRVDYWAQAVGVADHPSLHHAWMPYLLGLITALGLFTSVL